MSSNNIKARHTLLNEAEELLEYMRICAQEAQTLPENESNKKISECINKYKDFTLEAGRINHNSYRLCYPAGLSMCCLETLQLRAKDLEDQIKAERSALEKLAPSEKLLEIYGAVTLYELKVLAKKFSYTGIKSSAEKAERDLASREYSSVIGLSKEILEGICKNILDKHSKNYSKNIAMPKLISDTLKALSVEKGQGKPFAALCQISSGLAELRNQIGDGHGKSENDAMPAKSSEALLALNSASTLAIFMLQREEENPPAGK